MSQETHNHLERIEIDIRKKKSSKLRRDLGDFKEGKVFKWQKQKGDTDRVPEGREDTVYHLVDTPRNVHKENNRTQWQQRDGGPALYPYSGPNQWGQHNGYGSRGWNSGPYQGRREMGKPMYNYRPDYRNYQQPYNYKYNNGYRPTHEYNKQQQYRREGPPYQQRDGQFRNNLPSFLDWEPPTPGGREFREREEQEEGNEENLTTSKRKRVR